MNRAPSRILVPVDFSDCAPSLLREATAMGRALRAELVLLHVTAPPKGFSLDEVVQMPGQEPCTARTLLAVDANEHLNRFVLAAEAERVMARARSEVGPIGATILRVAIEEDVRMIVMGTHGRTGYARTALGSVAEEVMRKAEVPVTTVRTKRHAACAAKACATCDADKSPAERAVWLASQS
jgi:universal stress protein A